MRHAPIHCGKTLLLLVTISLFTVGWFRDKVPVFEQETDVPHMSLGVAEVSVDAPGKVLQGDQAIAKADKRASKLRKKLIHKLEKRARKVFKADAVMSVTYWPDLQSLKFETKKVFARGVMIRYHKFPDQIPLLTEKGREAKAA